MHNHNKTQCRHGIVYAQCRCVASNKSVTIVSCQQVHEPISEISIDSEKLGYWSSMNRNELVTIADALRFLQDNTRVVDESLDLVVELLGKTSAAIKDMDDFDE